MVIPQATQTGLTERNHDMAIVLCSMAGSFIGTAAALLWAFGKVQEIMWTDEDVKYEELD